MKTRLKQVEIYLFVMLFSAMTMFMSCNPGKAVTKSENPPKTAKRVVILGLDGISVPGYKTAKHPHLDKLMANGAISFTTRAVMPSMTQPNWTSHLTGSGPEQHGVDNNGWTLEKHTLPPVAHDAKGYYPSIFKVLKDSVPDMKTAYYYDWGNLINPMNRDYLDEINFEKDDKSFLKNYNKALRFAEKNKDKSTLIFLYSGRTDNVGHQHKWMSPEYISAIEEADAAIGELVDKFKAAGLYEDTYFLLITDHGGKGNGHGGMSPEEMNVPWAISGPHLQKGKIITEPNNNNNTAVVILRLFDIKGKPKSWTGEVPETIFEEPKE